MPERVPVPAGLTDDCDLPLPTGSGPRSGWLLFSARRGRARPGASLRRGRRRLGPRRARGRVWRSLRDLAQAGSASSPAPWSSSPPPVVFAAALVVFAGALVVFVFGWLSGVIRTTLLCVLIAAGWYRWALRAINAWAGCAWGCERGCRGRGRRFDHRAGWSVEQSLGLFEVLGGLVEVVVAALHPGFPPVEVAARLGPQDECEGVLEVAV